MNRLRWKWIFITLSLAAVVGAVTFRFFPEYVGLVWLFFYIIPSNSFIPFPHEPAIIYYGKLYGPMLTTLTALVPTIIACYIDYEVLTPAFDRTRLGKIRHTRVYRKTLYYFSKAPFFTNAFAALSPVPFYPVRILSISSGYPAYKYTLAVLLGRLPRYFILAYGGAALNVPNGVILLFFIGILISIAIQRWRKPATASPEMAFVLEPAEDAKPVRNFWATKQ
ncbi:MAG: VTT domain-containing protein [Calditrichaeota bacterium]|nr:VTT domain-containing protein [Calditrichota bacterium]